MSDISFSNLLLAAHVRSIEYAVVPLGDNEGLTVARSRRVAFHMILSGSVTIEPEASSKGPVVLAGGDIAILPSGAPHRLRCGRPSRSRPLEALLSSDDLPHLRHRPRVSRCGTTLLSALFGGVRPADEEVVVALPAIGVLHPARSESVPLFPYYASAAEFEEACFGPGARAFIATVAQAAFIRLSRAGRETLASGNRIPSVTLALRLMENSPDVPWTLQSLAQSVGISRSSLAQQFTTRMGCAPMAYLAAVRVAEAERLLVDTHRHISEIAWAVGYGSGTAFSRAFRQKHGMTPRDFRKTATSAMTCTQA